MFKTKQILFTNIGFGRSIGKKSGVLTIRRALLYRRIWMAFLLEVLLVWCEKLWGICCRCFISAVLLPTWLPPDEETDRQPFRNQCDIQSTCLPQDGRCCWGGGGFSCHHLILVWKSIDWAWQLTPSDILNFMTTCVRTMTGMKVCTLLFLTHFMKS